MKHHTLKGIALATAAAGLFSVAGLAVADSKAAGEDAKIKCEGVNGCKGKGACQGAKNACRAKNSCKGKGFMMMKKKDCEAAMEKMKKDDASEHKG